MNKRLLGVVAFAFVVAAGASLLLYRSISAQLAATSKPPATHLLVAAQDLQIGTLIRDTDVREAEWPAEIPSGAFTSKEEILGRGVIANIYTGEPILDARLAPIGAGAGLAATIPVGMRAVAVRVNDIVGVAGFVTPGMRVDILISGNPPNASRSLGTLSKTLLQNIEVLSAGQQIQKDAEGKPVSVPVVNLLVTPEQAEILSLASNEARIQLVLRNPLDLDEADTPGTALARLFTGERGPPLSARANPQPRPRSVVQQPKPAPPAVERPPSPITVEVIHGTKREESKFEEKSEEK